MTDDEAILAQANDTLKERRLALPRSGGPTKAAIAVQEAASRILARIDECGEASDAELAESAERDRLREQTRRYAEWQAIASRIGARYADCTLASFDAQADPQRSAVESVREYLVNLESNVRSGTGVMMFGPPGSGKDHLATAIMRAAVLRYGLSVVWTDGADFYGSNRDGIDGNRSEQERLSKYRNPDLLVLSDPVPPAGKVDSAFQLSMLFRVVDARYRYLKPTVVTLNVASRKEAEDRLTPNIIDRLAHGSLVLHCNWPSYRK